MTLPTPLVETDWLADRLGRDELVVIDASWRMPGKGRARDDFDARHIAGAAFFDIDIVSDRGSDLPHMLPSPDAFAAAMSALGVSDSADIVVYDDLGIFSAARVWWTFRAMGRRNVSVLNGGLKLWLAEGRPVTGASTTRSPAAYHIPKRVGGVARAENVRRAMIERDSVILDARPSARFDGREGEPRAGLRSGHIPNSSSLPFGTLLSADGKMRPLAELAEILAAAGVDERPVIATCGSGVTAAVIVLALAALGRDDVSLYDGAFAEWGRIDNDPALFPVAGGAAA